MLITKWIYENIMDLVLFTWVEILWGGGEVPVLVVLLFSFSETFFESVLDSNLLLVNELFVDLLETSWISSLGGDGPHPVDIRSDLSLFWL